MAEKQLKSSRTLDPYNYVLRVQPRALPDALAPWSGAQQAQIQILYFYGWVETGFSRAPSYQF